MKNTEQFVNDTLGSLDKLIDTLTTKKKHDEESVIKLIFGHLGFLIAYIDGEKELNALIASVKREVKNYLKLEKETLKKQKVAKAPAKKKAPAKAKAKAKAKKK